MLIFKALRTKIAERHPRISAFMEKSVWNAQRENPFALPQAALVPVILAFNPAMAAGLAASAAVTAIAVDPAFHFAKNLSLHWKLLKNADWRVAHSHRRKLAAMSEAEIARISPAERFEYGRAILLATGPEKKRLMKMLFKGDMIEPRFDQQTSHKLDALENFFNHDPLIKDGQENWIHMDRKEREAYLKKIVSATVGILGIDMPGVNFREMWPRRTAGSYADFFKSMTINIECSHWDNFFLVVPTAVHEAAHHWQHYLIDKWYAGELDQNDPRIDQIKLWALNNEYYTSHYWDKEAYRSQPLEQHARHVEKRAGTVLERREGQYISEFLFQQCAAKGPIG